MYNAFYKLDKEKQKRIINAALYVFSKNDFKHASTDLIASEAKIAKGSLFQYFKNKKTLYLFLYEYCSKVLVKKVEMLFDFDEKDYFEILRQGLLLHVKFYKQYPYFYQFVIKANDEKNPELTDSIAEVNSKIDISMYRKIYTNIDYSKFKEGTDLENLNKMINWCARGIWNEWTKNEGSIEEMHQQVINVIDFFRKSVYKEEYLV